MGLGRSVIRVILADDHPIVLLGVKNALEAVGGISIVGTATSPQSLLACLSACDCDVLVTDFSMPSERSPDGIAMLLDIQRKHPGLRIVVLTKISTPALLTPILDAGALALVDKGATTAEIATAVQRAAHGMTYISRNIEHTLGALGVAPSKVAQRVPLSPREIEVVRLFAQGYSNNQIAEILHLSPKTTSRQKKDAMRKLGAVHDADLYSCARDLGLI
ncbi:hypothetical protein CAL13_05025 [Bordetella genomosp. 9]|uniref:DNA-binding response regulator n=1 Tax=Bordetella genomosp. 9 TaxID=1416803 RepID=A0A1W6YX36_9BORD|nr:hypothetical protein CAL13_05025 [Bordetella genomosp. 9]